jgi:hypothetical protein
MIRIRNLEFRMQDFVRPAELYSNQTAAQVCNYRNDTISIVPVSHKAIIVQV